MKLKDNHYLMSADRDQPLYRDDPILYHRIMENWAALPATIRGQVCEALGFHYPLRAWGGEKGFGFWTMSRLGTRIAFHVGEPPPLHEMLLVVKVGAENKNCYCAWNHERPNIGNQVLLREKVIRAAFERMAVVGLTHRGWIHDLIGEIYPLRTS